jgi:seryl-tRNA synthetase
LHQNEAKAKQLELRRQQLAERAEELRGRVAFVVEQIKKKKEEDNPVVKQLKEHFKALREELKNVNFEEEEQEDDIDIDNMSYEVLPIRSSNCWN